MSLPKTFTAGERLFAADLNENFEHLDDKKAVINTDDDPGGQIYVGSVDPDSLYTLEVGDVWIKVP